MKKVQPKRHYLIGKHIEFLQPYISNKKLNIVLLTSTSCIHCLGVYEDIEQFLQKHNLNFFSLVYETSQEQIEVEEKSLKERKYIEFTLGSKHIQKYDLSEFPSFLLIDNTGLVIEKTLSLTRIDFLLNTTNNLENIS